MVPVLLVLSISPLLMPLALAEGSISLNIRISGNPDIVKTYLVGSYSQNDSGIEQIAVQSPNSLGGAAAVSWDLGTEETEVHALGRDFNVTSVRLSFDLMTKVLVSGTYGDRTGAVIGLATSPADCCPSDRSALLSAGSKIVSVATDCCYAGANLFFDAYLWLNPNATDSGARISKVMEKQFSGYAADATFHSYFMEMNLTSHTTTWSADGGAAIASYTGFTFTPSYLVFWAQGHDTGNYAVAQVRNIQLTLFMTQQAPPSGTSSQPSQPFPWWIWASIIGLSGLSALLLAFNVVSRVPPSTRKETVAKVKGGCPKCGAAMPPGSAFCGNCGSRLSEVE